VLVTLSERAAADGRDQAKGPPVIGILGCEAPERQVSHRAGLQGRVRVEQTGIDKQCTDVQFGATTTEARIAEHRSGPFRVIRKGCYHAALDIEKRGIATRDRTYDIVRADRQHAVRCPCDSRGRRARVAGPMRVDPPVEGDYVLVCHRITVRLILSAAPIQIEIPPGQLLLASPEPLGGVAGAGAGASKPGAGLAPAAALASSRAAMASRCSGVSFAISLSTKAFCTPG